MQQTTNYNLLIPEGTDIVNPLTQVNPNFQTIDNAMFANKQASIGTASEVVTGTVHAINRNNPDSDVFRFTSTGSWMAGDTMTLDGQSVTVHLSDGTTPANGAYIIGAEVLAMVNGTLVTLAISTTPPAQGVTSFNTRTGAVSPAASDYDASMIDYDNTTSGLNSTDTQGAIDEAVDIAKSLKYEILAESPASAATAGAKLTYLKPFYDALTDEQKVHCLLQRGNSYYRNYETTGSFFRFIGSASGFNIDVMSMGSEAAYQLILRTSGNTINDITTGADANTYRLIIV